MADRGRQVIRQWRVLRLLESSRRGFSVAEIHAALEGECERRTVYRDLDQLSQAGFPLVDHGGRWRLLNPGEGGWTVPLQPTELLALGLAEDLVAAARGSWLREPIDALRDKLLSLMTPQGRAYFSRLRAASIATAFGAADYGARSDLLVTLHQAICDSRVLRMRHTSPGRPTLERDVEPYSLWFHQGVFYLVAHCRLRGEVRKFAVERIEAAEPLDERFEPDPDFDAAVFVREAFGAFHGPIHEVVVDFQPPVAHLVRQRRFHHTQEIRDLPGGGARLTMRAGGLPLIAAWVAGFGGEARPVAPPELVEAVKEIHESGLRALEADPH